MTSTKAAQAEPNQRNALGPLANREATNAGGQTDGAQRPAIVCYAGERIYFRPLELEDEPLLRRWINDPRNWRGLMFRPPMNACREREWIESLGKTNTDYVFGVVVRDTDQLIGTTGLPMRASSIWSRPWGS